jgi:hypothetical protein
LIKTRALEIARKKVGPDAGRRGLVIQNITLTRELVHAIEAKMGAGTRRPRNPKYLQQRAQN